jgi:hypothetical protein
MSRYWPWAPNVGFSPAADASLRCDELRVGATSSCGHDPSGYRGDNGQIVLEACASQHVLEVILLASRT